VKRPRRAKSGDAVLDRARVLEALTGAGRETAARDLYRILGVKGEDRRKLKALMRELEAEGAIARTRRRDFAATDEPPQTTVVEAIGLDEHGELLARAAGRDGLYGPIYQLRARRGPALGVGERALARLGEGPDGRVALIIKTLPRVASSVLGAYRAGPGGGMVEPADRKVRGPLFVAAAQAKGAQDGDLVLCEIEQARRTGPPRAIIQEVIGRADDPRAASILAIHAHRIPIGFTPEEEAQAATAAPARLGKRTDLRTIPLVTIDPPDARDHDDAVFAEPCDDPNNKGGWRVIVAIADVAHYVTPGSPLDRGALLRGNSVYFPDRVAPMLPERLSADLCSLRAGEDRACLAVEMRFTARGEKISHRFSRALMRSAARLEYAQVQRAIDGAPDPDLAPLMDGVIQPLWQAYRAISKARDERAPLNLAADEYRVRFAPDGRVAAIEKRPSHETNRLIEEMMIQANVCAAETLEARKTRLIYRVHDEPSAEKIAALADFLPTIGLRWAKGERITTRRFNALLALAGEGDTAEMVNEMVLRSQMQAIYAPDNIGHFGLNLARYAHFTSPIRRYADLVVHRALIRALDLGGDGLRDADIASLARTAETITAAERKAMAAERDAKDRYVASFLADRQGCEFDARVTGVTRAGLFVRLAEIGADGLAPMSLLGRERFRHDAAAQRIIGEHSGDYFHLGQRLRVRLVEATPVSGGLLFEVLSEARRATAETRKRGRRLRDDRPGRPQARPRRSGR
jgi:ribonuclease R